jgi:hypothetical protein
MLKLKLKNVNGQWISNNENKERFPVWLYQQIRYDKRQRHALSSIENKKRQLHSEIDDLQHQVTQQKTYLNLICGEIQRKEIEQDPFDPSRQTENATKNVQNEQSFPINHFIPSPSNKTVKKLSQSRDNNSDRLHLKPEIASARLKKTFDASKAIHGNSENAARSGLWSTLVKYSSKRELEGIVRKSGKLNRASKLLEEPRISSKQRKNYICTAGQNLVRSVKYLYRGGLISKIKYEAVRCLQPKSKNTPPLIKYRELSNFIKEDIKIVSTYDVPNVPGCYRDLEQLLIKLASVYLKWDEKHPGFLQWFGRPRGTFSVAMGADGAPSGKFDTATTLLVSLTNVTTLLASCDHNYMLLGANAKEDDENLLKIYRQLFDQMAQIESKRYEVQGTSVSFTCDLLPNDLKMLATFAGELNNASTFPSSFSAVHKNDLGKPLKEADDPANVVKPWVYEKRSADVKEVQMAKSQNLVRHKVTMLIAKRNSRQEFEPVVGKYIDTAMLEPYTHP